MVLEIIKALSVNIKKEYENLDVYLEKVKSKVSMPCVFITIDSVYEEKILCNRYKQKVCLKITYFLDEYIKTNENLLKEANKIKNIIEKIGILNNYYNSKNIEFKISENCLIFYVTYSYYVYKIKNETEEKDKMQYMEIKEEIHE